MFNKINSKWLFFTFGALLLIYVLTLLFKPSNEGNFNRNLAPVDTAKITAIYIKPKNSDDEIKLERQDKQWGIIYKGKNIKPDGQYITSMLNELSKIEVEHIVSSDKNDWPLYDVSDSASVKVRVEQKGKTVANLVIGRYSFEQRMQKISTYVRINGEDEVYSVQGFLSMTFGGGLTQMRDKSVVKLNPSHITRVTFNYPSDSSFMLERTNNQWLISGIQADSAKTATYINALANLYSYNILENTAPVGNKLYEIKIEGNSFSPVQLQAFESDTIVKRFITSSVAPDMQFAGAEGELYNQVFVSKKSFLPSTIKK
jgi:hypothetical protein